MLLLLLATCEEPGYPLLLYALVVRVPKFRKYCSSNPEKARAGSSKNLGVCR